MTQRSQRLRRRPPCTRWVTYDHAAGNYRIFIAMAAELLMATAQRDITELDEKLYLEVFAAPETKSPRRTAAGAR